MWAMNALGFENYVEPLKIYLQKFREVRYKVYIVKFVEKFRRGEYYCTFIMVVVFIPCLVTTLFHIIQSYHLAKKNLFAYMHIAGTQGCSHWKTEYDDTRMAFDVPS